LIAWLGRQAFRLNLPIIRRILNGSTRVKVLILSREENQVLLVKNWLSQQKWTLPGGGVKPKETPDQAASREIKEELGLAILPDEFEFVAEFEYNEVETGAQWQAVILWCVWDKRRTIRLNRGELIKYAWFPSDRLPANLSDVARRALKSQEMIKPRLD